MSDKPLIIVGLVIAVALLSVPFWYGLAHYGRTIDLVDTATNGPAVEVLFIGSSVMQDAADPSRFTELDGRVSFNAALPRLYPEMVNLWMREQVMTRLDPEVVVLGVGMSAMRALTSLFRSRLAVRDTKVAVHS